MALGFGEGEGKRRVKVFLSFWQRLDNDGVMSELGDTGLGRRKSEFSYEHVEFEDMQGEDK